MKRQFPGKRNLHQTIDYRHEEPQNYSKRANLVTQYTDLPSRILDITSNGGTWDVAPSETDSAKPHQNVGGVSDAIVLAGEMLALIKIPDDLWNANSGLTYSWTLAGCVANPSCQAFRGSAGNLLMSALPGVIDNFYDEVPTCPTFSDDHTHEGTIPFDSDTRWQNPIRLRIMAQDQSANDYCSITVGRMKFVVNSSQGSIGSGTGESGSTGTATFITTVNSLGSTIVVNPTTVDVITSGADTVTGTSTNGTSIGTGSPTSTPPQISTLPNGSTVTLTKPHNTPISQPASTAESAKMAQTARMAGILSGALGGMVLIACAVFFVWRRRNRRRRRGKEDNSTSVEEFSDSNNTISSPDDSSNLYSPNHPSNVVDASRGWPGWQAQNYLLQSPGMHSEALPEYQSPYSQAQHI